MNEKKCLTCGIEVTDTCPLDQGEPPCEPKRDLNEDLAICNAATQGPWVYSEGLYVVKNVTGDSFEWDADFVAEAGAEEDAAFIAAAREGWPHAIRRAQAAESELAELRQRHEDLSDDWADELHARIDAELDRDRVAEALQAAEAEVERADEALEGDDID